MNLAEMDIEQTDHVVVATLRGEVDMSNADDLGTNITARVGSDSLGALIDLTDLKYLDSAGIRMLFEVRGRLTSRGLQMRTVVATSGAVRSTLQLVGAQSPLGICEDRDTALSAFSSKPS